MKMAGAARRALVLVGAFALGAATESNAAFAAEDSRIFDENFEGTVQAASCSADDVTEAFELAREGQTVLIPAGNCDWGDRGVTRAGSIRVRGAGAQATVLRRTAPVTEWGDYLMTFACADGEAVEISDIGFRGNDALQDEDQRLADQDAGLALDGCRDFRVHDVEFREFSYAGLAIRGLEARGVVYRGRFLSNFKCQPDPVDCLGYGVVVMGRAGAPGSSQTPLELGTPNAVFLEESYFRDNRHAIASNAGSRYVFRYNTVLSTQRTRNFGLIDAHGRGDYPPGSRSWEIYGNTIDSDPSSMVVTGISIRGGDGVIFGNAVGANVAHVVYMSVEEDCSSPDPVPDQTLESHIWGNEWDGPPPGYENGPDQDDPTSVVRNHCLNRLHNGTEYKLFPRPGYLPFAFPHPLR